MTTTEAPPMQGLPVRDESLLTWITQIAELTDPDAIYVSAGSQAGHARRGHHLVDAGTVIRLTEANRPGSYLARADPSDVARVESRTLSCSEREDDAGPTNNWMAPDQMRTELREVFAGSMRGRTMYVVPFSMGPVGGPISQLGVEITDSPYVVVSMRIMTRMGTPALDLIEQGQEWVPAVHSVGYPLITTDDDGGTHRREDVPWPCSDTKYISHFA